MCLAIPAKVIKIDGKLAEVEIEGVKRQADLHLVEDVRVNDYILLHAGFAIEKVSSDDAKETLRLLKEMSGEVYR